MSDQCEVKPERMVMTESMDQRVNLVNLESGVRMDRPGRKEIRLGDFSSCSLLHQKITICYHF